MQHRLTSSFLSSCLSPQSTRITGICYYIVYYYYHIIISSSILYNNIILLVVLYCIILILYYINIFHTKFWAGATLQQCICSSHLSLSALCSILCGFLKGKGWRIGKVEGGAFKQRGEEQGKKEWNRRQWRACLGTALRQGDRDPRLLAHACGARQLCPGLLAHTRAAEHFSLSSSLPGAQGCALACLMSPLLRSDASVPPFPDLCPLEEQV